MKTKICRFICGICMMMIMCSVALAATSNVSQQKKNAHYNYSYSGSKAKLQAVSSYYNTSLDKVYTKGTNTSGIQIYASSILVEERRSEVLINDSEKITYIPANSFAQTSSINRSPSYVNLRYCHKLVIRDNHNAPNTVDSLGFVALQEVEP